MRLFKKQILPLLMAVIFLSLVKEDYGPKVVALSIDTPIKYTKKSLNVIFFCMGQFCLTFIFWEVLCKEYYKKWKEKKKIDSSQFILSCFFLYLWFFFTYYSYRMYVDGTYIWA